VLDLPEHKIFIRNPNAGSQAESTETAEMFSLTTAPTIPRQPALIGFHEAVEQITTIDHQQKQQLADILRQHHTVFSTRPGLISGYEHRLQITDDTPYCKRGWPVPLAYREAVENEIQQMLADQVIERSTSPYINPLVTIVKKDGSVRLCLDARKINSVTLPDHEGSLPINEMLASCSGINIMSTIDLTKSFYQVPLHEQSRKYTGFLYQGKTYQFRVTPFGLKTSLASLTRGLDCVLDTEVKMFTKIYVDDCLCCSNSVEEHMVHLNMLLGNLKRANITINFHKSQFFRKEITYLGYRLSTEGVGTDPTKVAAILNFPTPRNHKQLKGFLGLANFYNRFSMRYAENTNKLLQLLKKDRKFKWTAEHQQQFQELKQLFIDAVVLKHPDLTQPYYLQTDASNHALGGQLYQYDKDGNIAVIAFTSRTFKGAECNYHTTEKELLAIIHCIQKFRLYLLGTHFTIITDNKALTFLKKCHLGNARITRWLLTIQAYDFDIVHCKGKENVVADTLSRYPEDGMHLNDSPVSHELEINGIQFKLNKEVNKDLKNINKLQLADEKLGKIIQQLKNNNSHLLKDKYKYLNERLYRATKGALKLYVPPQLRDELIKELHCKYGHGGIQKTGKLFKECFTGNEISKTLKEVIKTCDLCQRCKDHFGEHHGITKPILPKEKGDIISADYFGPLVTASGGVRYILVIVDNFTKFVKLYALRRATTRATLNRLAQYCQEFGTPRAILTDNGTQFTATQVGRRVEGVEDPAKVNRRA
jgi:hypothetical protein